MTNNIVLPGQPGFGSFNPSLQSAQAQASDAAGAVQMVNQAQPTQAVQAPAQTAPKQLWEYLLDASVTNQAQNNPAGGYTAPSLDKNELYGANKAQATFDEANTLYQLHQANPNVPLPGYGTNPKSEVAKLQDKVAAMQFIKEWNAKHPDMQLDAPWDKPIKNYDEKYGMKPVNNWWQKSPAEQFQIDKMNNPGTPGWLLKSNPTPIDHSIRKDSLGRILPDDPLNRIDSRLTGGNLSSMLNLDRGSMGNIRQAILDAQHNIGTNDPAVIRDYMQKQGMPLPDFNNMGVLSQLGGREYMSSLGAIPGDPYLDQQRLARNQQYGHPDMVTTELAQNPQLKSMLLQELNKRKQLEQSSGFSGYLPGSEAGWGNY